MTTNADVMTAADVAYNWSLMTPDEQKSGIGFGLLLPNQPDIQLFRTRKGCLGILEVLKAPGNSQGVRICYKVVRRRGWVETDGDTDPTGRRGRRLPTRTPDLQGTVPRSSGIGRGSTHSGILQQGAGMDHARDGLGQLVPHVRVSTVCLRPPTRAQLPYGPGEGLTPRLPPFACQAIATPRRRPARRALQSRAGLGTRN